MGFPIKQARGFEKTSRVRKANRWWEKTLSSIKFSIKKKNRTKQKNSAHTLKKSGASSSGAHGISHGGIRVFFLPPPLSLDKSHHLPPPRPAHKSATQEPDLSRGISQTLESCCRSSHPSQKAHLPPKGSVPRRVCLSLPSTSRSLSPKQLLRVLSASKKSLLRKP